MPAERTPLLTDAEEGAVAEHRKVAVQAQEVVQGEHVLLIADGSVRTTPRSSHDSLDCSAILMGKGHHRLALWAVILASVSFVLGGLLATWVLSLHHPHDTSWAVHEILHGHTPACQHESWGEQHVPTSHTSSTTLQTTLIISTTQPFTTLDPKEQFDSISAECEAKVRKSNNELQKNLEHKCTAQIHGVKEQLKIAQTDFQSTQKELQQTKTELETLRVPSPSDRHEHAPSHWAPQETRQRVGLKRYAFVMMAYNKPGSGSEHLWGVLAMARTLHLLSKYPLLILTNSTHFSDGTRVDHAFHALNAKILPVSDVPVPSKLTYDRWIVAWWKIQVWKLTEYEKLIWLDSDAILYRSVDYLFDRSWMWAQRDDWTCQLNQQAMCSGIFLLFPNEDDYDGILYYANTAQADLSKGDQKVIMDYFTTYTSRPINLLSDAEAAFGQCIGTAQPPYLEPDKSWVKGLWSMPSFVHKSGGWSSTSSSFFNVCFQHNVTLQLFRVGSTTVNVCHFNPLGPYWRERFCEAVVLMKLQVPSVIAYCSDDCWVRGESKTNEFVCGPISSGVTEAEYFAKTPGLPISLLPSPTETVNLRKRLS